MIVVVQVGAVKIYIHYVAAAAAEALKKKKRERQYETQFPTKIGGKLVLDPELFCFVKFSFPIGWLVGYLFDALLCPNWPFLLPNRLTLWITLLLLEV
jgi:hypothetical protein